MNSSNLECQFHNSAPAWLRAFNFRTHVCLAILSLGTVLFCEDSFASNLYWDINGTNAGAGGPAPSGIWDGTTPLWSTSSSGTIATTVWTNGSAAIFSAGADSTGAYTVTLSGTKTATNVTFQTGVATLVGSTLNLSGPGVITVNTAPVKGIIASPIGGSVGLTKSGSGELVLSSANTFTGNLTAKAGTLTLDNAGAAGFSTIVLSPSSAVALHSSQSLTITNNITVTTVSPTTIELDADPGQTLELSGVIGGSHNWLANGSGTLQLAGSTVNNFGGVLTVAQGTVLVAKDGALGSTVNGAVVNAGATISFEGDITYSANKFITLSGAGIAGGASLFNASGENYFQGTVVLATNSTIGAANGSILSLVGPITGGYNLTKVGNGGIILNSAGDLYGTTLVSAGTLAIAAGGSGGSGLVTVSSGAVFAGEGNVAMGGINLSGMVSPGQGIPATLGSGPVTWQPGGSYDWTINDATGTAGADPGNALLNISGTLTINAVSTNPFVVHVSSLDSSLNEPDNADNFDNTAEYTWTIATASGGIIGFDTAKFSIDANGLGGTTGFVNDQGNGAFILQQSLDGKSINLSFVQKPAITTSPVTQTGTRFGGVTFDVVATGSGTLHYQWFHDGAPISGSVSSILTLNNLVIADDGIYSVVVSNLSGFTVTNSADLTVQKAKPEISWSDPAAITFGTPLTGTQLNAMASGAGGLGSSDGNFIYTPADGAQLNAGSAQVLHVIFSPTNTADYTTASAAVSINVVKADQTITFAALPGKTYGDAPFTLGATVNSPLTVEYASSDPTVASVTGNTVTILKAGTTTITASQAGDTNYNAAADAQQILTVGRAALSITASNDSKTYGTAITYGAGSSAFSLSGLVYGDTQAAATVTITATDTPLNGTAATDPIKSYTLMPSAVTGGNFDLNNYTITYQPGLLTVNPLTVTVTADAQTKVYGSTDPELTYQHTPDLTGTDVFSGSLSRVPGENVGSYAINQGSLILSTNYLLGYAGTNLLIIPAPLTITAAAQSKSYGETKTFGPGSTMFTSTGLTNGDAILTVTITAANSPAGTNATDGVGTYSLTPSEPTGENFIAENYDITLVTGVLTVNPAILAVTANETNRVYGAANPVFTASYSGFVNDEDASLVSGMPDFTCGVSTNAPVGAYRGAIVVADAGSLIASNYIFSMEYFTNGTLMVAVASLTPAIVAADKTYDGTTNVMLTSSNLTGVVNNDEVILEVGSAGFADKTAADGKTVTATGLTLGGASVTNYILSTTTATAQASITTRTVTVIATGVNRIYDGTTSATASFTYSNQVDGDSLTNSYIARFDRKNKNVGIANPMTVSGIELSGTDAANYALANTTAATTANIVPEPITVTAVTDSRQFDGTINSSVIPQVTSGSVQADDSANFIEGFDTPNVGNNKTLTPSGSINDDNDGQNYTYTFAPISTGTITAAPVPSIVYVDASYAGLPDNTFVGWPYLVSAPSYIIGYNAFATVQSGINGVTPGGVVNVAAGSYAESVTANKSLTLLGANQDVAGYGNRGSESLINGGANNAITITAANVVVNGFALNGYKGVVPQAGSFVLVNNIITATNAGIPTMMGNVGIDVENLAGLSTPAFIIQSNSVVAGPDGGAGPTNGTAGILLALLTGTAPMVSDNNIAGSPSATAGYILYAVTTTPALTVSGGTISNVMQGVSVVNVNPTTGTGNFPSTFGVADLAMSAFNGTSVYPSRNVQAGVVVNTSGTTTSAVVSGTITNVSIRGVGNIFSGCAGIFLNDGSRNNSPRQQITVLNSTINDNANRGIFAVGSNLVVTVKQCQIQGNGFNPELTSGLGGLGVAVRGGSQVTLIGSVVQNPASVANNQTVAALNSTLNSVLTVTNCSIDNNGSDPRRYLASQTTGIGTLNAAGNWWGFNSDTAIINQMTNGATVVFTPYLNNGSNIAPGAPGFAGDFSTLHVTALGAQTAGIDRIQQGHDLATGDTPTVIVDAGTYNESVVISKDNFTLQSAQNAGMDARYPRGAESILNTNNANGTIQIVANNVTVDGMSTKNSGTLTAYGVRVGVGANNAHIKNTITGHGLVGFGVYGTAILQFDVGSPPPANIDGVLVDGVNARALLENNNLTGDTEAGLKVLNGATADAGNCGTDITGLGSSAGGNNLSGYLSGSAKAVINVGSTVSAEDDNFGATKGGNISNAFTGTVAFSQNPQVLAAPAPVTVTCVSEVPAGATTLDGFIAQGGYFSASAATVTFADNTNFIGSGVITRTYTVTDACGNQSTDTQVITVSDTIAPTIAPLPDLAFTNALAECSQPNVTWNVVAFDNCQLASVISTPASGSTFAVGTTMVTTIATDTSGNTSTNAFNVKVVAATATTLAVSTDPVIYGSPVTFTATVAGCSETVPPTGTVTFKDGETDLATITLDSGFHAAFTTSSLAAMDHHISAVYSGDTYHVASASNPSLQTVSPKELSVTGITANNKVYDGVNQATLNVVNALLNGAVEDDDVVMVTNFADGKFDTMFVGLNKTVTISGLTLTGTKAGNYTLIQPTATANISAASLTPSIASANKFYDGNDAAAITDRSLIGTIYNSDEVSLVGGTATFDGINVGSHMVTATGLALSGGQATNYVLSAVSASTNANITAASVTVVVADASRGYGDTNPVFTVSYNGFVNDEGEKSLGGDLVLSSTADTNSPVGNYAITASGYTSDNYTIGFQAGSLSVTNALLTITANDTNKVYGQTVTFAGTEFTVSGLVSTDSVSNVTLTSDGALNTAAVGSSPYNIEITNAVGDDGLTNYLITYVPGSLTINKADPTILVTPYSVTYDGLPHTAEVAATGALSEDLNGDVALGGTTHTTAGGYPKDAWTFTDAAGNYNNASGTVADVINKADATINVAGCTGIYDGGAHGATGTATGVNEENLSDLLSLGDSFTTVPGGTAEWSFAGDNNYNAQSGSVGIEIKKADATISVAGYTGVYDGAAHGATGTATGVNGENLSALLSLGSSFTTVPGGTAEWSFAGDNNYNAQSGSVGIGINKADATVNVTGYSGIYDGAAHGATGTATGVNGENLSGLLSLGNSFTTVPGGTAEWSFAGDNNYNAKSGSVDIAVGRIDLTITANGASRGYGDTNPVFTVSYNGFVNDEGEKSLGGDLVLSSTADTNSPVGNYAITASGYTSDNYTIGFQAGSLSVTNALLTITANDTNKVYGQTVTFAGTEFTVSGLVSTDSVSNVTLTSDGALNTAAVGSSPYNIEITNAVGDDGLTNYLITYVPGSLTINKADPTILVTPYSVTYDGLPHTAEVAATGALSEDLNGDVALGGTTHTTAGGYPKDAWTFTDAAGNYNNASGTVADVINKADATINVAGCTGIYDGGAHGATGTATGVNEENLSDLLSLGDSFTTVPGGTAEWSFAGDNNYNAQSGSVGIEIKKADATISVAGYTGVYDGAAHGATGTATGVNGENLSALLSLGSSFTTVPGGTAEWSFAGDNNYNAQSGSVGIGINKADATVTADSTSKVYGTTLTFTGLEFIQAGLAPGDAITRVTLTSAGAPSSAIESTYDIVPNSAEGTGLDNYKIHYINGTLTVQATAPAVLSLTPVSQTNMASTTASFTVSASGPSSYTNYQWVKITATATNILTDGDNISGSTSNVLTIANVLAADQAEYAVTVSNPAGSDITNGTLTVIDPAIFVQPVSVTNILGGNATFIVDAAGTAPLSYQWQQDGFDLPDETNAMLTLNDIQPSDIGDYTVVVFNGASEKTSEPATLTLTFPPVILNQPASLVVKLGATATFAVSVNGLSPFTYQWMLNGVNIANATNRIFGLSHAAYSDVGSYQVVVENPFGTQTSQMAILTVAVPLEITIQPTNVIAIVGQTVNFSVSVTGTPLYYQWHANNTNLVSANGPILTLNNVNTNSGGTYFVTVTNIGGTVTSRIVMLTVYTTTVPILKIVLYADHQFTVGLTGVPTYNYSIDASSNLTDWVMMVTNASPFTFTVTNRFDHQFYRGHYLP